MKKQFHRVIVFCMILAAAVHLGQPLTVFAASAAIGFSLPAEPIMVGDVVSINLTVDADADIGDFEGYISYDSDYLEFKTGATCIAGGDGILKLSDVFVSKAATHRKYILKFIALKPGSTEIVMLNQPDVYDYGSSTLMSVSVIPATITIEPAAEASDNAMLETLKISPGDLSPQFHPEIFHYKAIVSKDTGSLYVGAKAQDAAARVTVAGNSTLFIGENTVQIFVTAETGRIQEYEIIVTREEETTPTPEPTMEEEPSPSPEPEEPRQAGWVEVKNEEGTLFLEGNYRYEICEAPESLDIPPGYEKTKLIISGFTVTAYAASSGSQNSPVLLVLKYGEEEPKLYRYDRTEKTIQKFLTEDVVITREESGEAEELSSEEKQKFEKNITTMGLVISVLTALLLLSAIGLIYFYMKSKGMRNDDLDE